MLFVSGAALLKLLHLTFAGAIDKIKCKGWEGYVVRPNLIEGK